MANMGLITLEDTYPTLHTLELLSPLSFPERHATRKRSWPSTSFKRDVPVENATLFLYPTTLYLLLSNDTTLTYPGAGAAVAR